MRKAVTPNRRLAKHCIISLPHPNIELLQTYLGCLLPMASVIFYRWSFAPQNVFSARRPLFRLPSGGGPGPPDYFGPPAKKFAFTRQKIRRAVPKVTARVPILEVPDPKWMCCKLGFIRGRRRQRKRRWKSVFVFFQSSSRLLQVTNFVKCRRILVKLNS